jgi:hypothetical protein
LTGLSMLRVTVLALAGLEILAGMAIIIFFYRGSTDPLGRNIAYGIMALTCVPLALCALPALLLGLFDRWLPLALFLALAAIPVWLLLMRGA